MYKVIVREYPARKRVNLQKYADYFPSNVQSLSQIISLIFPFELIYLGFLFQIVSFSMSIVMQANRRTYPVCVILKVCAKCPMRDSESDSKESV